MKNIESNLTESRKYKPDAQFSSNANLNPRLLNESDAGRGTETAKEMKRKAQAS